MSPFLTAEWKNLINITYQVNAELLTPYLPKGLELETRDGMGFVSLVAFEFRETRLKGIKIPYHVNFPEINLRFYVREGERRGVVFIRELVPRYWIAKLAQWRYNEPYEALSMDVKNSPRKEYTKIEHRFGRGGLTEYISLTVGNTKSIPAKGSDAWFFKEHEWGFGQTRSGKSLEYHVTHPEWEVLPILGTSVEMDFGKIYGPKWSILNDLDPFLELFAIGSEISVFPPKELQEKG